MARIAEHHFVDDKCQYCGVSSSEAQRLCEFRDAPPRAVPVSVFTDLGSIGDRLKEILREEQRT